VVFIHGTASSTEGSFGGLWQGDGSGRINQLLESYQGQVLALQHRTLTQSPLENALELVRALPEGALLHLVSHSRGGMVGELVCRGMMEGGVPFDETDFALFERAARKRDLQNLKSLADALSEKQLRVERFVRVACPARGTTLADRRLDRYLSLLLNILSLTGLKASPIYDALSSLLLAVVHKRTDPEELPGIEAMMPESPLVALLNRPGKRCHADLHVLGGDIKGQGILGRLKVLATDFYYREDHDLVVNTPSMFGGAARMADIRYWIDHGGAVDHFSYFRNPDTAERLLSALLKPDQATFHTLRLLPHEITMEDYRKRTPAPQPIVFVLPGIMGSHLQVGKNRVWLDFVDLSAGGLRNLKFDARDVIAEKPLGQGYGDLIRFLASSHEVMPFPYDWRDSVDKAAERLADAIEAKLTEARSSDQPIRLLAHSMGGLVVRALLSTERGQQLWSAICEHPGGRFIMLGTPCGGSHAIAAMLLGRDRLVGQLALLDLLHGYRDLLSIIAAYPGVMQLLPETGSLDLFDAEIWRQLFQHDVEGTRGLFGSEPALDQASGVRWVVPEADLLRQAQAVRTRLAEVRFDPERTSYVAGRALATPVDVRIEEQAEPGRRVIVMASERGDGRVPWDSGIPAELLERTWYMDALHGDLAATSETFPALLELLQTGFTSKLPSAPPLRRGGARESFPLPPERPAMYPSEFDLAAAALGGAALQRRREPSHRVRIRVVHGDLAHAESPVLVGHYVGDTIVSAEAYLDRVLNGSLRKRNRLGLYPGALNTAEVFLGRGADGADSHPGAVVLGLGRVGELTPGALTNGVAQAAVAYVAACMDCRAAGTTVQGLAIGSDGRVDVALTTLLLGTGAGGISVADSLRSLLLGLRQANDRLAALAPQPTASRDAAGAGQGPGSGDAEESGCLARITRIDVIELYEDRAIQAVRALLQLARSAEVRDAFEIVERLESSSEGGRRRAYFEEDPAWWQRLSISVEEDDSLKFDALTDRARSESLLQPTQRRLVERFIDQAAGTTATDAELSHTLFELLLPQRLKERAPERRNTVLVLDQGAAAYPWELLHDRFDRGAAPLAVQAGMVRQLSVPRYREQVIGANENVALVVGDPANKDKRFPVLPGARAEAEEVAQRLRDSSYEVQALIGDRAEATMVLRELYARRYRVLHLAAHGVFEFPVDQEHPDQDKVSGMALGDGMYLTTAEIEQLRYVPDLVFLNCCHLGQAKGEAKVKFHRLAANLATQLIRMGARVVIAAGWAVNDAAAATFARTFYDEFLRGVVFGEAVRVARVETYTKHGEANTWGAYQCYGDPDFGLHLLGASGPHEEQAPVALAELCTEIDNFTLSARRTEAAGRAPLLQRLQRLAQSIPQDWLRSAAVRSILGRACGELMDLEAAVGHYQAAVALEPADADLETVVQLANLRARWAEQLHGAEPARAQVLFEQAEAAIDGLIGIAATPERHSVRGSIYKRRALCRPQGESPEPWLREMGASYRRAYELAGDREDLNFNVDAEAYALQNWLTAEVLLNLGSAPSRLPAAVTRGLHRLDVLVEELPKRRVTFWILTLRAEAALLHGLARQNVTADLVSTVLAGFSAARPRLGSTREWQSVVDNHRFLLAMVSALARNARHETLVGHLQQIVDGLRGY
jgi:hypothetical protein